MLKIELPYIPPKERIAQIEGTFQGAQKFIDTHPALFEHEDARREAPDAAVVEATLLHHALNMTGKALIDKRGDTSHLIRITAQCELLGLLIPKKQGSEFFTIRTHDVEGGYKPDKRKPWDIYSFDPVLEDELTGIRIAHAMPTRSFLYKRKGAKDLGHSKLISITDILYLVYEVPKSIGEQKRVWHYESARPDYVKVSKGELDVKSVPMRREGERPQRSQVYGSVWRGLRERHYANMEFEERAAELGLELDPEMYHAFALLSESYSRKRENSPFPVFFRAKEPEEAEPVPSGPMGELAAALSVIQTPDDPAGGQENPKICFRSGNIEEQVRNASELLAEEVWSAYGVRR